MRRLLLILTIAAAASGCFSGATVQPAAAQGSYLCTGAPADYASSFDLNYPEPRHFEEIQAWWSEGAIVPGGDSSHIHVGLCFPQGETWVSVNDQVRLDFRIIFHHMQAAKVRGFRGAIACCGTGGGETGFQYESATTTALNAVVNQENGTAYVTKIVQDNVTISGSRESRFTVDTSSPFGAKRFYTTGRLQSYWAEGPAAPRYRATDSTGGCGWYEGDDYICAAFRAAGSQIGGWHASKMGQPVPASWVVSVGGSDASGTTRLHLHLDPNFHVGDPGTVLVNQSGSGPANVTINTTLLAPGWHKLFVLEDEKDSTPVGTNSGGLMIPFLVGG
jgi:hypothetical protein